MTDLTRTYEPDNSLKRGILSILVEIFNELVNNRWLTYQLFKRDFLATYKQAVIGMFWAFIIPLISVGTFALLNRSGVFVIGNINVPYAVYAVAGVAFWQLFSTGLIMSTNSLVKAGSMIVKINFSKKSLVIAAYCQAFIPFLVQLIVLFAIMLFYGIVPGIKILLIPIVIIPVILLSFGMGLCLSMLNAILRDIGNIVSLFMTFLMFLTPIFFVKPTIGFLSAISKYNPLYYLIATPRDIVTSSGSIHLKGFLLSSAVSAAIFCICIIVFHITEVRISERV